MMMMIMLAALAEAAKLRDCTTICLRSRTRSSLGTNSGQLCALESKSARRVGKKHFLRCTLLSTYCETKRLRQNYTAKLSKGAATPNQIESASQRRARVPFAKWKNSSILRPPNDPKPEPDRRRRLQSSRGSQVGFEGDKMVTSWPVG